MIACYVRVSTTDQNPRSQKRELSRWLRSHGIKDAKWYEDAATGDSLDRPGFEQLQKEVFDGRVKTVVIWKLDRLSRNLRDGLNILADWFDRGLRVVSITQQIDFSGATGKLIAAVLLGVAVMEQETRRERQRVGIEAAKERGVYQGRKPGTFKGKPRRAQRLRTKGLTQGEIAEALGVSRRTVIRYLNVD